MSDSEDPFFGPGGLALVLPVTAVAVLLIASYWFAGFVQDDVFISLRYARNLADGRGLVFNEGERVEGFTNLSWTLLAALLFVMKIPPLPVLRVVGTFTALAMVWLVWNETGGPRWRTDPVRAWAAGLASLVVGCHTTFALWAGTGLEESLFTLLLLAGMVSFARERLASAAAFWVAATWTRPEGGLAFALALAICLVRHFRDRSWRPADRTRALCIGLGGLALLEGLRLVYYGDLVPNTFYVKGVANRFTHRQGLGELVNFALFDSFGLVLLLAAAGMASSALVPVGERDGWDRIDVVVLSAGLLGGLLYHTVRVAGDILPMYRMYMPVVPLAAVWAGKAMRWFPGVCLAHADEPTGVTWRVGPWLCGAAGLAMAWVSVHGVVTTANRAEYRTSLAALEQCHGAVGDHLERLAVARLPKPTTVIAQDMGLTPYRAMTARFVDVIGLTDRTIARTLYDHDYNPYVRYLMWPEAELRDRIFEMEKALRAYLDSRSADFVVINASCEQGESDAARAALARGEEGPLARQAGENMFYYGLAVSTEFRRRYRLSRGFEFSPLHWLLLYERRPPAAAPRFEPR